MTDDEAMACRVLVVDDDPFIRRLMATLCADIGADVQEAENGAEAVLCIQRGDFDLIVLDLDMPVMNGHAFWRRMRDEGRETPIIIVSAHRALEAAREMGAVGALEKPFDIDDFTTMVRANCPYGPKDDAPSSPSVTRCHA